MNAGFQNENLTSNVSKVLACSHNETNYSILNKRKKRYKPLTILPWTTIEKAIKNHIKLIHHYFLRYFSVLISYFARIVFLRRCFWSLPTISYNFSCIFIVILFFHFNELNVIQYKNVEFFSTDTRIHQTASVQSKAKGFYCYSNKAW